MDLPPAMSTFPFGNNVAVWPVLAMAMLPVAVNVPAAGSYSSALARTRPLPSSPPAMSTFPLPNNVAVWYSPCHGHAARRCENSLQHLPIRERVGRRICIRGSVVGRLGCISDGWDVDALVCCCVHDRPISLAHPGASPIPPVAEASGGLVA